MAIQIRKSLTASPDLITLPKRIELTQTLRSNRPSETIQVVYRLAPGHNVWFVDSDGLSKKDVDRKETVGRDDQECVDRLSLAEGPGTGPMDVVEIAQTITDASGVSIGDSVSVRITR